MWKESQHFRVQCLMPFMSGMHKLSLKILLLKYPICVFHKLQKELLHPHFCVRFSADINYCNFHKPCNFFYYFNLSSFFSLDILSNMKFCAINKVIQNDNF